MKKKNRYSRYAAVYSISFLLLMAGILFPMVIGKRSLIWNDDGKSQYYLQLAYMGRILREFFGNLIHGRFSVRMYDFTNGMGDDINTLVRFHPLDFLSVFVPEAYTEILYNFLIFLRIYLGGLAFSAYCFYWKKKENAVLIGSMIYISSGYVLKLVLYHPTFGSAMIMLPLILIGAEEVMKGKRKLIFSFFVFLSFTSNYYFTYMITIAAVFYVLLRMSSAMGWKGKKLPERIRSFFQLFFTFAFYYGLGTGMAALTLLPIVSRLMASPRISNEIMLSSLWVYPFYRYGAWLLALISPYMDIGSITKLNFAVFAAPALILLFSTRRTEHRTLRVALVLEWVLLMLPLFGYVMSGFSNVNNRWTFIISFTLCLACVVVSEEYMDFGRLQERLLIGLCAVMSAAAAVGTVYAGGIKRLSAYRQYIWVGAAGCILCVAVLLFMKHKRILPHTRWWLLSVLTAASCIVNGFVAFDSHFGNTAGEFLRSGEITAYYDGLPQRLLAGIEDEDTFYRVDTDLTNAANPNASLYYGYQGIAVYNSVLNAKTVEYMLDQENPGQNGIIRLENLDGRTGTEQLANVKYLLTRKKKPGSIPAGFEPVDELSAKKYTVYRNSMPLSFGYTYDTLIREEDYKALPALEKQQVLLSAAVVETKKADALEKEGCKLSEGIAAPEEILTVPVALPSAEKMKKVEKIDGGYSVKKKNARLKIPYMQKAGYECYLRLVGLGYQGPGMVSNHAQILVKNKTGTRKIFTVRGQEEAYYLPREDFCICMGVSNEDRKDQLTIRFKKRGTFYLENIELCYIPVSSTADHIKDLNAESLRDVRQSLNQISGVASITRDSLMVFSIPYSSGWTAAVDGKETEMIRANTTYMGIFLPEGEHTVILTYTSPGLKTAVPVFLTCWIIFLAVWAWERSGRRKRG